VDAFRQTWFQRRREFLASTQKISTVELAGGNLDAGQPRAGQLRQASIILPRGMDGQQRSSCVLNWKSRAYDAPSAGLVMSEPALTVH
jgi:hypothetical protein